VSGLPFRLLDVALYERQIHLRLPFRFGVVTLREAPQAFVRVRVQLEDGREAWGMAAELMVPKWFDKRPESSNEANIEQLRRALTRASRCYLDAGNAESAFQLAETHYEQLVLDCGEDQNPLAAQFGPSRATSSWSTRRCVVQDVRDCDRVVRNQRAAISCFTLVGVTL